MTTLDHTKLAAARLRAVTELPYLATALFALEPVPAPGLGRFAVDTRWHLYCDPAAVGWWTVPQLAAVLVHEVNHLLRDHAARADALGAEPQRWNVAADAEINDDLLELRLALPGTPVTPRRLGLAPHRLAEEYHQELDAGRAGTPPECGSGSHGTDRPWEDAAGEGVPADQAVAIRLQTAADIRAAARTPGEVPAGLLRWAAELGRPTVDWRRVLATAVRRSVSVVAGRVDYSHRARSRRAGAIPGVVLPGLVRHVPRVAVVCDTSGSMADDDLAAVLSEVDGILAAVGVSPSPVTGIACDSAAHGPVPLRRARDVELRGGGGTDMGVGITAAASLRPRPDIVIVLTDGFTPWPQRPPPGTTVVVARIGADARHCPRPPSWASCVDIEVAHPEGRAA